MNSALVVRIVILAWSSSLMTLHYAGYVKNMDATFIASIFTSTLATFGIESKKRDELKSISSSKKSVDSNSNTA